MFKLKAKLWLKNAQSGFGLLETIVAIGLFMIVVSAGTGGAVQNSNINRLSDNEVEATLYAQEGIEAIKSIANQDWANLSVGTYGIDNSAGYWTLSGSSNISDPFTRTVLIEQAQRNANGDIVASGGTTDLDTFKITTIVEWDFSPTRNNTVDFVSYVTNFKKNIAIIPTEADYLVVDATLAFISGGGNKELQGITIKNIGTEDITIDTIIVEWNVETGILMEEVKIDATSYWKFNGIGLPIGKQPTGTELDLVDFVLSPIYGTIDIDKFKFDGDMSSEPEFTITFKMIDGSTKIEVVNFGATPTPVPMCGATQADDFDMDTTFASIGGGGNKELLGLTIENIGSNITCLVTIDSIKIDWTNGRLVQEFSVNHTKLWSFNGTGSPLERQPTGTTLDIVDKLLLTTDGLVSVSKIKFNGSMIGDIFNITYTFLDGSSKSFNGITL